MSICQSASQEANVAGIVLRECPCGCWAASLPTGVSTILPSFSYWVIHCSSPLLTATTLKPSPLLRAFMRFSLLLLFFPCVVSALQAWLVLHGADISASSWFQAPGKGRTFNFFVKGYTKEKEESSLIITTLWTILFLSCDSYVSKYMKITACFYTSVGVLVSPSLSLKTGASTSRFTHAATLASLSPVLSGRFQYRFCPLPLSDPSPGSFCLGVQDP